MNGNRQAAIMEKYILDHLDEALARGDIKIFLQPVVRTLTRQVCGLEALVRWQTEDYGLLMPGSFIEVLKKNRRIHDLDIYVIRTVCRAYSRQRWRVDVPVSVNLSRLDFDLCDIFEIVESTVRTHKVPRNILCIEITESALASNEKLMHEYIDRFRSAGYAVWMDDFGSGYSSFNILKDFTFDELKIDMRFMSDFHTRSKKILASIIHMAKDIGMQTLAEGVETEEQFDFLRNIGCEKVQGYLFGKPMLFKDCVKYVKEQGMTWETPTLRRYYDDIGRLDVLSASPFSDEAKDEGPITGRELNSISLAIIEIQRDNVELLLENQAFENMTAAVDWPLERKEYSKKLLIPFRSLSKRLQKLLEEARTEGREKLLLVYDNDYYDMRAFRLARHGSHCAILITVTNLSRMSALATQQQLDEGLRSLYSVYEQVSMIDLKNLTVISLYLDQDSGHRLPAGNLLTQIEEYTRKQLFLDDKERFRHFIDPETLEERASQGGSISIHVRVKSLHGNYDWKCYELVRIRKSIYYLLRRSAESEMEELRTAYESQKRNDQIDEIFTPELLWKNVVNNADIKFFWKDHERRFVGVSQRFLDHYSFESQDAVIGKTDEDMGWHIHNDPFRDEEWKVINEGITSKKVEGNCLVQGEDHEIVATKMPLYNWDGKIVGLIGQFYQTDSQRSGMEAARQARTDDLTGLLNSRGLYEDFYAYVDEYRIRGRDFARIEVGVDGFEEINTRYGFTFGDSVIRETGQALLAVCGNTVTIGRGSGPDFIILRQYDEIEELYELIGHIRKISEEPCHIDGTPFNIYLSVGMSLYSESRSREIMAAQAEMRRMTDDVESISQKQLIENSARIFNMFEELPLPYAVYKIVDGPEGCDAVVLYINKQFMNMTNLTLEEFVGKRVSKYFSLDANNWLSLAEQAGLEGKCITGRLYDDFLECDLDVTAYPVIGPGFCAFTFQKDERYDSV